MTQRCDFHRLPTGAWASEGPAPVDNRPWKSLRAHLGATLNRIRHGRHEEGIPDTCR